MPVGDLGTSPGYPGDAPVAGTARPDPALSQDEAARPDVKAFPKPNLLGGLIRSMRPRQWLKNVLVLAAPGAGGALGKPTDLAVSLGAVAVFCAVAGGTYLCNDVLDAEADRLHPTKKNRPIAAGEVPKALAAVVGLLLIVGSVTAGFVLAGTGLASVIGIYAGVTLGYSAFLKQEPVVDLAAVAAGFVLRAIAGGVATHVVISHWFLIVASFGSMFMVTGKRYAEHKELGDGRAGHRSTLASYSRSYLLSIVTLSAAVTVTAYCLWAFERATQTPAGALYFELSIIPFVIAILRYALLLDHGQGGAPEEVVLSDRRLQVLGVVWAILFAVGVYA